MEFLLVSYYHPEMRYFQNAIYQMLHKIVVKAEIYRIPFIMCLATLVTIAGTKSPFF